VGAVRFLVVTDLRRRWRTWLGLAVLLGLTGALVMGAAAGARRTASAYPRLVESTNAFDILVNPDEGDLDPEVWDAVESLPQVAEHGRAAGILAFTTTPDGEADFASGDDLVFFVTYDEKAFLTINRPKLFEGRLPDPSRPDEALLAKPAADARGMKVGSEIDLVSFTLDELEQLESGAEPPPEGSRSTVKVVGVGLFPQDVPVAATDRLPIVSLTPAFERRHHPATLFVGSVVKLKEGTDAIPAFVGAAQRADGDEQVFYQTQTDLLTKASRAARPYWGALAVFAVVAGLAGLLIVSQAVGRQLFLGSGEHSVIHALGMGRRHLLAAAMGRVLATGLVGAAIAAGGTVLSSLATPIGPARVAEPHPGLHFDAPLLAIGATGVVVLLVLACALPAWRAAAGGQREPAQRSRLAEATVAAGLPVPAVAGVRMAMERGKGRTAVPVRATVMGAAVAVAALTAAITFAVSLDHLLTTPRLYGGDWDASVVTPAEDEGEEFDRMSEVTSRMERDDDIAALATGSYAQLTVNNVPVPAVALEGEGQPIFPTIVHGRAPRSDGELLLGAASMERAGLQIGDSVTITAGAANQRMTLVGEAVFPRFSAYPGADKTGLGEGAAVTRGALADLVPPPDPDEEANGNDFVLVRFEPGIEPAAGRAALFNRLRDVGGESLFERVRVAAPERPDDILGYEDVSATPIVLAGLLALLAGATTAHALISAVRRRRTELAVLKTLGFLRSQVRATVAWQATTIAVIALVVGLPLGVAAGRWGWTLLADRMHAVAAPVTPLLAVFVLAPLTLLIANAMAAAPARTAARTEPAVILRSE
jgi:hypothetical protein